MFYPDKLRTLSSTYSTCDFHPDEWILPAVKTDQPKGASQSEIDSVPNEARVVMGQRFRLNPTTNCDDRLAPMYQESNGLYYPPTLEHTAFVRMFCRAMRDYGSILSDGSGGCGSFSFQGENTVTADWEQVFGSSRDLNTGSWSYLIRDLTTPYDNRYRDERHGVPWWNVQVLAVSDVGIENDCCGVAPTSCDSTPAPTYTPFVDTTPGTECLNENCCFKHRKIHHIIRIADDNCVVYNCTFVDVMHGSDLIKIYLKFDGSWPDNILIEENNFAVGTDQDLDGVHIERATNVMIRNNIFSGTLSDGYSWITINGSDTVSVEFNTFGASAGENGIKILGAVTGENKNINIFGNTFSLLNHGIRIDQAANLVIRNNIFSSLSGTGLYFEPIYTVLSEVDGLIIENNTFSDSMRAIWIGVQNGALLIKNNIISNMGIGDASRGFGIDFDAISDGAVVDGNIISGVTQSAIRLTTDNINMIVKNNIIYDTGKKGIDVRSDTIPSTSTTTLTIENNMIYGTVEDNLYFWLDGSSYSPAKVIIRFNTFVYQSTSEWNVYFSTSQLLDVYIYCNLGVASSSSYHWPSGANINDVYNYETSDLTVPHFENSDTSSLSTVDLHLKSTSPAVEYCNLLNVTTYPLVVSDFEGNVRPNDQIDAGADALARGATLNPTQSTGAPTLNPVSVTSVPITSTPTAYPITLQPVQSNPTTSQPTQPTTPYDDSSAVSKSNVVIAILIKYTILVLVKYMFG